MPSDKKIKTGRQPRSERGSVFTVLLAGIAIAGALLAVGRGEADCETIRRAIEDGERANVIATAPAHGLTLVEVRY